jgi:hypothetical protein
VQQHRSQQGGCSSWNTQHLIDHSLLLFAAVIRSTGRSHQNKNSNSHYENIRIRRLIKSEVSQNRRCVTCLH